MWRLFYTVRNVIDTLGHILLFYFVYSHLPLYLVASFAKKISRLSLSAPPEGNLTTV